MEQRFAPWNAEATVPVVNFARFDADARLDAMERCGVDAFCAPPTVWRILIQADAIANTPGQEVRHGSMGLMVGYRGDAAPPGEFTLRG